MDFESYERLIEDVISQFSDEQPDFTTRRKQRCVGLSGQAHRIDIAVEFERLGG